jgi:hypothetical protein
MITWAAVAFGAVVSGALAGLGTATLARERRPAVLTCVSVTSALAPVAWHTILKETGTGTLSGHAPLPAFPVSWQDAGSAVFTVAAVSLVLGEGPLWAAHGRRVAALALLCGAAALLAGVYAY